VPSSLIVPGGRPEPAPAPPPEPQAPAGPIECITAFAVYQTAEGEWRLTDIDTSLSTERTVNADDLTASASVILRETEPGLSYPQEAIIAETAFIVYQLPNGLWQVSDDLDIPLVPQRTTVPTDVVGGLSVTLRDTQTREIVQGIVQGDFGPAIVQSTTQSVIASMGMVGQQMAEARDKAAVAAKIEADRQRRGGR